MKSGDLVKFSPSKAALKSGANLTAVKYFMRIQKQIAGRVGVVIQISRNSCLVNFGEDNITLNVNHLEVVNENQ